MVGDTGVGKSTVCSTLYDQDLDSRWPQFIQAVTGLDTGVGQSLYSKTATVSLYCYKEGESRVVDIPIKNIIEKLA